MSRVRKLWSVLALAAFCSIAPHTARADGAVEFGPNDVRTVFYIAKSENKVEVHYGLRLDAACRPVGKAPVFGYWSRPRTGYRSTGALDGVGKRYYAASDAQKVEARATGGHVQMYVKALQKVVVDIDIQKTPQGCVAVPTTTINRERAQLSRAYLQFGSLGMSVKYVDIVGSRLATGARVVQRIQG